MDSDSDYELPEKGSKKRLKIDKNQIYSESQTREINSSDPDDLKLVNKICLKRDFLIRMSSHLYFKETVKNCLVKTTYKTGSNKIDYRIGQILDVIEKDQSYSVEVKSGKKTVNKYLLVKIGNEEKEFKFMYISNKGVEDRELYKWLQELSNFEIPKPTVEEVENKYEEINSILHLKYTAQDIKQLVEKKVEKRFKSKFFFHNFRRQRSS